MFLPRLKTLSIACLSAALLSLSLTDAFSETCSVPAEYPTIQSAIEDASCSTIIVAPGIYSENLVISRSATLSGAQMGQPFGTRTSGGDGESVLRGTSPSGSPAVILIDAPNVTVDGFTVQNAVATGSATGIRITSKGNDAVVLNSIFDGISTTDPAGAAQALYLESGPDNVNVSDNEMKNIASTQAAKGVWIGNAASTNPSEDVLLKGNSFSSITSSAAGAYGLLVDNFVGGLRFQFRNNNVSNLTGATVARGVALENDTNFSQIFDNNFSVLNSPRSAAVWLNYPTFFQPAIHGNNFDLPVTAYGIEIDAAIVARAPVDNYVNSVCNWWGSATGPGPVGPGSGARVSRYVGFAPWRIAPAPEGECTGNNVPSTEGQCKQGGWTRAVRVDGTTFKNQGDCIQYLNNGK